MSIQNNFPAIKPTLLLDFANTEQLDPRITFTRASTATFYGTQTAKAEENLFLNSQTFQTNWTVARVTVATDTTAAPDGTTTADTITNTTATGAHAVDQAASTAGFTIVSGLPYTISVFAKKSTNDFFQITTFNASNTLGTGRANFNLATGAAGTVDGGTSTITDVGNGWYRCTYTVTASASGTVNIYFGIITTNTAARFESYTGLGTEAVFIWGAQLEQRSAVTAYTATTTQPITNYIPVLQTAASGVARFDHNPTTFESLGLEIEESRTNLLTYSEQFDNASWTKTASTIEANTVVSPDGTLDADKLIPDTTSGTNHPIFRSPSLSSGTYTGSIYVKAAGYGFVYLRLDTAGGQRGGIFSVTDESAGTVVNGATISKTNVGNGWYRLTATVTDTVANFVIVALPTSTNANYAGDGYSGIYIWGAQLEAGAFATSYIPTVASQVTRAADAASMTGTNFSSWYNQAEGTLYAESATNNPAAVSSSVASLFASASNYQRIRHVGALIDVTAVSSGATTVDTDGVAVTVGAFGKTSMGFRVNDYAQYTNASSGGTDSSAALPVGINVLNIGSTDGSSNNLNGTIRKIAYYPIRVSNTNLQALTS